MNIYSDRPTKINKTADSTNLLGKKLKKNISTFKVPSLVKNTEKKEEKKEDASLEKIFWKSTGIGSFRKKKSLP